MLSNRWIAAVSLIAIVCSASPVWAQGIFPDKNLEAAVRKQVFAKRES